LDNKNQNRSYAIKFHSFAGIITNSSSELFMVTNSKTEAEIIDVICNLYKSTEAEPDDINITLIADVSQMIDLALAAGISVAKKLFKIIDVECDVEPVEIRPAVSGWTALNNAYELQDSINLDTLKVFISDNEKEIQDKFMPFLYVRAWCQDSEDFGNIVRDLNGIELGGF